MSKEAKLKYYRENINKAKSREKGSFIFLIIGLVLIFIDFIFYENIIFQASSLFLTIIGIVLILYFNHQKQKLIEQLRKMAYKAEKTR